jgi:hypothetical protein
MPYSNKLKIGIAKSTLDDMKPIVTNKHVSTKNNTSKMLCALNVYVASLTWTLNKSDYREEN